MPHELEISRGVRISGGLVALAESDDSYLIVEARRPSAVSQPSIQFIVEGQSNRDTPSRIEFLVESSASVWDAVQWVDLYNFEQGRWDRLDTREATRNNDSVTLIKIEERPRRYVEGESGHMRARVSFWDPGISIVGWTAAIDRTVWRVVQ